MTEVHQEGNPDCRTETLYPQGTDAVVGEGLLKGGRPSLWGIPLWPHVSRVLQTGVTCAESRLGGSRAQTHRQEGLIRRPVQAVQELRETETERHAETERGRERGTEASSKLGDPSASPGAQARVTISLVSEPCDAEDHVWDTPRPRGVPWDSACPQGVVVRCPCGCPGHTPTPTLPPSQQLS